MGVPITHERKRDAAATKAKILDAARRCFSKGGYANTGIRDVAAEAGVSYALPGRYFGSKAGLLEAALIATLKAEPFLEIERASFGENLAALIIGTAENSRPMSMTVLSAGDPDARDVATRIVKASIVQPLAEWIGPPCAEERAVAITMLGAGFVTHSQLIPLLGQPRSISMQNPVARWLAETFQMIVDEPERWRDYATDAGSR